MEKVKAFLSQKVGGIPVGAIVAIIAGLGLYLAIRMPKGAPVPDPTVNPGDEVLANDGQSESQPAFKANTVLVSSGATTTSTATDTNTAWARRAKIWLTSQGVSIDLATRSIDNYINGVAQLADEVAVRDRAITQFGLPPEDFSYGGIATPAPADPVTGAPDAGGDVPALITPPPANVTSGGVASVSPPAAQGVPPLVHHVRNQRDNTAGPLALLYYNNGDAAHLNKIKAANTDKPNPPWAVGQAVYIPEYVLEKFYVATQASRGANDIAAKNGITAAKLKALNPGKSFPVAVGTRVRVR